MASLKLELNRNALVFSLLFGLTSIQILPIPGLGVSGFTVKYLLIMALLGYLFIDGVLLQRGKIHASPELQAFALIYTACALALILNGVLLSPGTGFIISVFEFLYILPLLFALYHLFQSRFEVREAFLKTVTVMLYTTVVVFMGYFASKANIDIVGAFKSFFSGTGTLQYELFALTFAYVSEGEGSSSRHTMMFMFFMLLVLIRVSRQLETTSGRARFSALEVALVLTIVVIGMSRKVVLALLLFYILNFFVGRRFSLPSSSGRQVKSIVITSLLVAAVFVGLANVEADTLALFQKKYIEQVLNNPRFHQFGLAVEEVTASTAKAITGAGLGQRIYGDPHYPHNILFYFFHQVGLIGLLPALCLFGFLVLQVISALTMAFRGGNRDAAYVALGAAACLLVPFFRLAVGDKGGIALEGAIGLSLGFALLPRARSMPSRRKVKCRYLAAEHARLAVGPG